MRAARVITVRLVAETVAIALGLGAATWLSSRSGSGALTLGCVIAQGLWLHRLYLVGHEASHRKLWPGGPRINDALGQAMMLPLLLPLRIHRKIHAFHHAHNRRDPETSALDTFVVTGPATPLRRCRCRAQWYLAVFAGGWFLHGLVSVLLFLALPLRLAQRVSPAFRGWTHRDQLRSIGAFALGLALHFGVGVALGAGAWLRLLGGPLLVFAWVYSLLVYIYHYDTGYGPAVRAHVRSAGAGPVFSWWLLNFGEHATHHADPRLPWWSLPEHAVEAPRPRIGAAVLAQLRGPRILERGRTQWT